MAERVGELPPSHWLVDDVVAVDDDGNEIIMSGDDPIIIERGGPGSGHHGHKGRPGKIGGSLPSSISSESQIRERLEKRPIPTGDCFHRSANWIMDEGGELGDDVRLVHGTVAGLGSLEGIRFVHAWVEFGGLVYDADKEILARKERYYEVGVVKDTIEYTPTEMQVNLLKNKHWGPWDKRFEGGPWIERGGPGSGHFEHEGRPGEVGGSLPGDAPRGEVSKDIFVGVPAEGIEIGKHAGELYGEGSRQPSGAPIRGTAMDPDDERIPDTVFHMTTDVPGIRESAEVSARGFGGLGGDRTDQIVSMTIDEDIAKSLVHDTRLAATISREFLLTQPDFHYVDDEWKVVDKQTGEAMDSKVWSKELIDRMNEIDTAAGDWEFSWDFEYHNPKYGIKDWFSQYFMARNRATDLRNPLFFTPAEDLAAIDPGKVGYVRIPRENLKTGALLTDFDLNNRFGLREVRLYGDVPLAGAEFVLE